MLIYINLFEFLTQLKNILPKALSISWIRSLATTRPCSLSLNPDILPKVSDIIYILISTWFDFEIVRSYRIKLNF